jgi:hypothetical protein
LVEEHDALGDELAVGVVELAQVELTYREWAARVALGEHELKDHVCLGQVAFARAHRAQEATLRA